MLCAFAFLLVAISSCKKSGDSPANRIPDNKPETMEEAIVQYDMSALKTFLSNGESPDRIFDDMDTPLHIAAAKGNVEAIAVLLEFGANMEKRDKFGCTPLHLAVQNKNDNASQILLQNGANVNALDNYGLTPMLSAAVSSRLSYSKTKLLLSYGADVNISDNKGQTPLIHAAGPFISYEVVELLIKSGANVHKMSKYEGTALSRLMLRADSDPSLIKILDLLLNKGIDVNASPPDFYSPLQLAIYYRHSKEVIQRLLEHGADACVFTQEGLTLIEFARQKEMNEDIIDLLAKYDDCQE